MCPYYSRVENGTNQHNCVRFKTFIFLLIRLGLNVALTHQNMSYRDSETKENVETQKRKQRGGNDRKRTTKKGKKQLIFVWFLVYNLSDLSGPTRNMKIPADLACKIKEIHKPPPTTIRC